MENSAIVQRTLQLVKDNLEIYIEINLREVYGNEKFILFLNNPTSEKNEPQEMIDFRDLESNYRKKFKDVSYFINLFLKHWEGIFKPKLTKNYVLSLIHSIRYFRNRWAHQSNMTEREVYRLVDEAQALLEEIGLNTYNSFNGKASEIIEEMNQIRLAALEKLVYTEMHKHNNCNNDANDNKFNNNRSHEINYELNNPIYNNYEANYNFEQGNLNENYHVTDSINSNYPASQHENFSENQNYLNPNLDYRLNNNNNKAFNLQFYENPDTINFNNNVNNIEYYSNSTMLNPNFNNENNNSIVESINYNNQFSQGTQEINKLQNEIKASNKQEKKDLHKNYSKYNNNNNNNQAAFEEDKQMQEYDKILMKNQQYDKIINQNLNNKNNHFNVYVHSDDDN